MKIELEIPEVLAQAIADAVVAQLKKIVSGLERFPRPTSDQTPLTRSGIRLGGVGPVSRGRQQPDDQRTLPTSGYLRLREVLAIIPVSKSTWYKGIADGRYPKPTKGFGPRIAAWDVRDIQKLVEKESP